MTMHINKPDSPWWDAFQLELNHLANTNILPSLERNDSGRLRNVDSDGLGKVQLGGSAIGRILDALKSDTVGPD